MTGNIEMSGIFKSQSIPGVDRGAGKDPGADHSKPSTLNTSGIWIYYGKDKLDSIRLEDHALF